jgi:hypothetical protein
MSKANSVKSIKARRAMCDRPDLIPLPDIEQFKFMYEDFNKGTMAILRAIDKDGNKVTLAVNLTQNEEQEKTGQISVYPYAKILTLSDEEITQFKFIAIAGLDFIDNFELPSI